MKRVVIIGAGPCGLVALKEMLAGGHEAMLFERSGTLGGVFASTAVYPNLHLTISNWAMSYSDFPDPERLCYASAEQYLCYLKAYACHFDLERHISYNCEVTSAGLEDNTKWHVEVCQHGKNTKTVDADALIVATGTNQVPKEVPRGLAGFRGETIHSTEFSEAFKKKVAEKKLHVLVVGGGESGADISADLGELSPNVTVWLRRPMCVGPRYLVKDNEMEQVAANHRVDFPANAFLEAATTNRMSASQNVYMYGVFRRMLWHTTVLQATLARMSLDSTAGAVLMNDQASYVTKNQRMCEAVGDKKVELVVCDNVLTKYLACSFRMPDGTIKQREFDAIVVCTGFRTEYPWLKVSAFDKNPRSWFLHCFPKDLGHCLFFVGYARPHQGGIPPVAELLSRYVSLLLRGERALPLDYAQQALRDQVAEREHYHLSPDLDSLVDYNAFSESVARRVGCEPRVPLTLILAFNLHMFAVSALIIRWLPLYVPIISTFRAAVLWLATVAFFFLFKNGLMVKWWFYPQWSVWYRQRGPGSDPALPEKVLQRVDLWKATAITKGFVMLVLWSVPTFYAQRLLSVFLFLPYVILDSLGLPFPKAWGGLLRPKMFTLHSVGWRFSDLFIP